MNEFSSQICTSKEQVKYSEDLINMSAGAFIRDTHVFDARDKYKCKEWVAKQKKRKRLIKMKYL